jgi:hypothetical protein
MLHAVCHMTPRDHKRSMTFYPAFSPGLALRAETFRPGLEKGAMRKLMREVPFGRAFLIIFA